MCTHDVRDNHFSCSKFNVVARSVRLRRVNVWKYWYNVLNSKCSFAYYKKALIKHILSTLHFGSYQRVSLMHLYVTFLNGSIELYPFVGWAGANHKARWNEATLVHWVDDIIQSSPHRFAMLLFVFTPCCIIGDDANNLMSCCILILNSRSLAGMLREHGDLCWLHMVVVTRY